MKETTTLAEMLTQYRNGERGLPTYEELLPFAAPAATSGDAPTDLQGLKQAALDAKEELGVSSAWPNMYQIADGVTNEATAYFMARATPAVVLDLTARIERSEESVSQYQQSAHELAEELRATRIERAAAPAFNDAEELAVWLDNLHESDASGSISNRKWEPAQRAAAAVRAAAPAKDRG